MGEKMQIKLVSKWDERVMKTYKRCRASRKIFWTEIFRCPLWVSQLFFDARHQNIFRAPPPTFFLPPPAINNDRSLIILQLLYFTGSWLSPHYQVQAIPLALSCFTYSENFILEPNTDFSFSRYMICNYYWNTNFVRSCTGNLPGLD